ncbi:hypothetical protein D3C75_891170 [compost metagenome]
MIRAQALQTLFTAAGNLVQTGIVRVHLGNEKNLIPDAPDGFTHQFFGTAVPIHFGGINEIHTQLHPQPESSYFLVTLRCAVAHVPGSLAHFCHGGSVLECDRTGYVGVHEQSLP